MNDKTVSVKEKVSQFWTGPKGVVDLEEVAAITQNGWILDEATLSSKYYSYAVSMRSGCTLNMQGTGLIIQFKAYKGIE